MSAPSTSAPTGAEVAAALRKAGVGDVSDSVLRRALYACDASLYRVVPAVVAHPREAAEAAAALAVCRALGIPLTCRGAGTSIAGNAVGPGVVLDFSKHMHRVLRVDPDQRAAAVEPGVVQAALQRAAAPFGLRFGPDPSTHNRCTIGGMIGNNACGSRSLAYGRTSDNVEALDILTAAGGQLTLAAPAPRRGPAGHGHGPPWPGGGGQHGGGDGPQSRRDGPRDRGNGPRDGADGPYAGPGELSRLRDIVAPGLGTIRTEFGRLRRQVSGYALEHLLPERGFDVRRALVGSEGTLAVVTGAVVRLVPEPGCRVLAVLGYQDMASAADAVPAVLEHGPLTCEGLDSRIVDVVRGRRGQGAVPDLPSGWGWLFTEVAGATEAEALSRAQRLCTSVGALAHRVVTDPGQARALWRIREDGAGLAGRTAGGRATYPGWEDSAVPPASLGAYLRDLDELLDGHGLAGVPYGHFGEGCLHLRLDFPLERPGGREVLRTFLFEAAALAARYGGSLSGEHGDGRARSELLPVMYSPAAVSLFGAVKACFDPEGVLNPGVVVAPDPVDASLRTDSLRTGSLGGQRPARPLAFGYRRDHGDFTTAAHRCSGVGKCVADTTAAGGVMCPSYLATRDEKDSTRGRARMLQEMAGGTLVTGGWRAPEVRAALDLCLACKACASECPAGVDMATYKAEVLYQAYRHRLRPRSHYALGWLPSWARVAGTAPRLVNAALAAPGLGRAARFAAGVDSRRALPPFARQSLRAWFARHQAARPAGRPPVLLFTDTFTDRFAPQVGIAAVQVLERAGFAVTVPSRPVCCGLTWISTGQLGTARRVLRRTAAELAPSVAAGIPVIGLEPSCTAVLRSDAVELLGTPAARALAGAVATLGEFLASVPGWRPPPLPGVRVLAQPHCHHSSVLGWDTDAALLRRAGADVTRVGGCCGLAGNFGAERGHYPVSVAVAETALLPAVRAAAPGTVLLADGFSCRTQLADLAGRQATHLAQLLAGEEVTPAASR